MMNSKIKQLAEQVGAVRNVLAMGRHDGVLFTEFELEKFAELIVRECASIYEGVYTDQQRPERIDTRIKQHFGVE
jgi:hypothetical protein